MEPLRKPTPVDHQDLARLLDLQRRARLSASERELAFLLVNDSHEIAPYRQAVLWSSQRGVVALSGLLQPEANAPYVQWLQRLLSALSASGTMANVGNAGNVGNPGTFNAHSLAALAGSDAAQRASAAAQEWADWWPAEALWLEVPTSKLTSSAPTDDASERLVLVLVGDAGWSEAECALLGEWVQAAGYCMAAHLRLRSRGWRQWPALLRRALVGRRGKAWWQRPWWIWATALGALLALPVHLSVLAPGELVPANPTIVRAPLEGVVDVFHIKPNDDVRTGQPLFGFDEALIQSRMDVARQVLATAEVEYRQTSQQALSDPRVRPQMAGLVGKIEEKRAELSYLREQRRRSQVVAPRDGVVLLDDPNEWIGRPVSVGERILSIAAPHDVEVEAWLPLADAIALPDGARVQLFLHAAPTDPIEARLRYLAHSAVQRPDGTYAYRVRARLEHSTQHRVGLKGTAKLLGPQVSLGYWLLRRPLAAVRGYLGV